MAAEWATLLISGKKKDLWSTKYVLMYTFFLWSCVNFFQVKTLEAYKNAGRIFGHWLFFASFDSGPNKLQGHSFTMAKYISCKGNWSVCESEKKKKQQQPDVLQK